MEQSRRYTSMWYMVPSHRRGIDFACHDESKHEVAQVNISVTHRYIRVGTREGISEEEVVRQLALALGLLRQDVLLHDEGVLMSAHDLNAGFGEPFVRVYGCIIVPPYQGLRYQLEDRQKWPDIVFVDLLTNTKDGRSGQPESIFVDDLLLLELELMGAHVPCKIHIVATTGRICHDILRVESVLKPAEILDRLEVCFVSEGLNESKKGLLGFAPGPLLDQVAEPALTKRVGHEPIFRGIGIVLYPVRDATSCRWRTAFPDLKFFHGFAYEALLTRLYGKYYQTSIIDACECTINEDFLQEIAALAIRTGHYAQSSLPDAFSASIVHMSRCFSSKIFARSNMLPPPRFPPAQKGKQAREVAGYEGGRILSAEKGLYTTPTAILDFDSHYPSIIAEFGLFPRTADGRVNEGLRADMAELIEHKRMEESSIKRRALKLVLVYYYGSEGSRFSTLYAPQIASKTTEHGRALLEEAKLVLQSNGLYPIFGHTDSVAVTDLDKAKRPIEQICRDFNAQRKYIRLEVEKRFARCWVLNQTTYIGHYENSGDLLVLADYLLSYLKKALEVRVPMESPVSEYVEICWSDVVRQYATSLVYCKKILATPGLISSARPRCMNTFVLFLAALSLEVTREPSHLVVCQTRLKACLALLDPETESVDIAVLPLWSCEFPLATLEKARHPNSSHAQLSARIWDDILARHNNQSLRFAEKRLFQEHLRVHSYEHPETGPCLVDPNEPSRKVRVNKYKWLELAYRRWRPHIQDLQSLGKDEYTQPLTALFTPLEERIAVARPQRVAVQPNSRSVKFELPQVSIIPKSIEDIRPNIVSCKNKKNPQEQLEHVRSYLKTLAHCQDQQTKRFSLSLLLSQLDPLEALRATVPNFDDLEKFKSHPSFQTHAVFYRQTLALVAELIRF